MIDQTSQAQRKRALTALEQSNSGLTTIELREQFDCIAPAARVYELRHNLGKNIQTINSIATNAQGNSHRAARYVLLADNVGV